MVGQPSSKSHNYSGFGQGFYLYGLFLKWLRQKCKNLSAILDQNQKILIWQILNRANSNSYESFNLIIPFA